jgi:integrase
MRSQDPDIQQTEGKHPRFFIRPYVDRLVEGEIKRVQERIYLTADTKREAIREKNRVMETINNSKYVIQAQMNFDDLLDHYLKEHVRKPENLASGTRSKYESHIKNHVRPAFGHLPIALVNTRAIDIWLGDKAKAGLSWNTRVDLRNVMSAIFTQARKWGYWREQNPAEDATVGRERATREPVKLTLAETQKLLAALPKDVRLICEVALFCTLRISEVLGLQWRHIDFSTGRILVRQRFYRGDLDVVKTRKAVRDVPMGLLARDLKQMFPGAGHDDDFVFSVKTHGGRCVCRDDRDINQHFLRPAAKTLGIYKVGFGFHAFRREAVTMHAQIMGSLQTQRMAGHSKADMTQHYTLSDFPAQEESVLALQNRVRKVVPIKTDQAKKPKPSKSADALNAEEVKGLGGGPERTRISDLYRVKVAL